MYSCYYYQDPPKDWETDPLPTMPKNYLTVLSEALTLPVSDRIDLMISLLKDFKTSHQGLLISGILSNCDKEALKLGKSLHSMSTAVNKIKDLPLIEIDGEVMFNPSELHKLSQKLITKIEEN